MSGDVRIKVSLANLAAQDKLRGISDQINAADANTAADLIRDLNLPISTTVNRDALSIREVLREWFEAEAAIDAKRAGLDFLGSPTSAFSPGAGDGYFRHYQSGSIFWTPSFGAHEVHGAIRDKYAQMGWERSYLGYPTTDELSSGEVRYSDFQGGIISWTATRGAYMTPTINVFTERHQLGGWIWISGKGFTPSQNIHFLVDGLTGFQGSYSIGSVTAGPDGTFADYVFDASCRSQQDGFPTVRAVDVSGAEATASTSAFNCG